MGPLHPDQYLAWEVEQERKHKAWLEEYGGYIHDAIDSLKNALKSLEYVAGDMSEAENLIQQAIDVLEEVMAEE